MSKGIEYIHVSKLLHELYEPGQKILEFGAGNAQYRYVFKSGDYLAGDILNKHYSENNQMELDLLFDVNNMPFKDKSFDIIFCVAVFGFLEDPLLALTEIVRVLKDDGIFICFDYTYKIQKANLKTCPQQKVYLSNDLIQMFENCGLNFEQISINDYSYTRHPFKRFVYPLLSKTVHGNKILNHIGDWRISKSKKIMKT